MDSRRRTALVAGLLYLVTFASSIPAVLLLDPVLSDPNYVLGAGADAGVRLGAVLDLVNAFACVGTAVALFSVIRREHEGFALGFVTTRVFEAAVIVIGVVCILAVVTLRQSSATGASAASLVPVAQGLVAVRNWTFIVGPSLMPAFNAVMLGYPLYRARLVPRLIPTLGLIGAPLLAASTIATVLGANSQATAFTAIATLPIALWELLLGLWLTFRGFSARSTAER